MGWLPPMATCHCRLLKWAGFDRSVIWDLLTIQVPTVLFAVNIALMSALCPAWFRESCWILPLYCEKKNGIWVVFFVAVTQPNKSAILHIWPQSLRTLRWECFDTIHLFHIITNMPKTPVDLGKKLLQPPSGERSDRFLLPFFPCLLALF